MDFFRTWWLISFEVLQEYLNPRFRKLDGLHYVDISTTYLKYSSQVLNSKDRLKLVIKYRSFFFSTNYCSVVYCERWHRESIFLHCFNIFPELMLLSRKSSIQDSSTIPPFMGWLNHCVYFITSLTIHKNSSFLQYYIAWHNHMTAFDGFISFLMSWVIHGRSLHTLIFFLGTWQEILLVSASLKELQLVSTELHSGLLPLKESLNAHMSCLTLLRSPLWYKYTKWAVRYSTWLHSDVKKDYIMVRHFRCNMYISYHNYLDLKLKLYLECFLVWLVDKITPLSQNHQWSPKTDYSVLLHIQVKVLLKLQCLTT